MAQLRLRNRAVSRSNLLAVAVMPLGKTLYSYCLVLRKGLKAVSPLVTCIQAVFFLVARYERNPAIQCVPEKKQNPETMECCMRVLG